MLCFKVGGIWMQIRVALKRHTILDLYCGGVDWTSPIVLAFSCIYEAFGFLPSYTHLTHYEPTRIHSFLPFLLTDYD